jgi:hypothetical protein
MKDDKRLVRLGDGTIVTWAEFFEMPRSDRDASWVTRTDGTLIYCGDPDDPRHTPAEKPIGNRASMLREAESLVDGDRNSQYGDPIQDFQRTADFLSIYLNGRFGTDIHLRPHDIAILMMLLKISRLTHQFDKRDTWVDTAGYAACGYDCVERQDG